MRGAIVYDQILPGFSLPAHDLSQGAQPGHHAPFSAKDFIRQLDHEQVGEGKVVAIQNRLERLVLAAGPQSLRVDREGGRGRAAYA